MENSQQANPSNAASAGNDEITPRTAQQSPRMRELKVEDALLYLDQVKLEFSDKPHIYNEFLEIMKNFKAQSINTPGVIERVKNLFRGYNKLILGFNTFLPEGEGYKIELTPEEENMVPPGSAPPPAGGHPSHQPNMMDGSSVSMLQQGPALNPQLLPQQHQQLPMHMMNSGEMLPHHGMGMNMGLGMGMGMGGMGPIPGRNIGQMAAMPQGRPGPMGGMGGPPNMMGGMPVTNAPQPNMQGSGPQFKPPQQMQQQHAISYVTNIRNRFANEPETYRAFLKILHTYQKEQKGIKDVLEQVSQLFADHPDLLMEFTYFLPDAVQEQAKERLHRAARESELRRRNMLQQQQHQQQMAMMGGMHGGVGGMKRSRMGEHMGGMKHMQMPGQQMGMYDPMNRGGQHMRGMQMVGQNQLNQIPQQQQPQRKPRQQRKSQQEMMMHQGMPPQSYGQGMQMGMGGIPQGPGGMNRGDDNFSRDWIATGKGFPSLGSSQHLSSTAERRFFDTVKDAMYSYSRDSWNEFVKCLDLFASSDISKKDMLELVKDLFGSTNQELFEEFKRLLSSRDSYEANGQDLWFSVPLSEVDFTQCLRCTPSYRGLPKDYPRPQCSERGEMESAVLNDDWVSIPIGSEESYSFKHFRKNQYEEALFKCEDDRFEIDMIIDSNMSTIRILEPIAEEIAEIQSLDSVAQQNGRFSFQLESKNLSTIHINSISRLYGDHGPEILELLRKNPAGTIPVVLKRLKQKDYEWRKARQDLNQQWKETMAKNFEKSFDHRSFYFKQQDKKMCLTRNLIEDIRGTPPNPTANTGEPLNLNTTAASISVAAGVGTTMGNDPNRSFEESKLPGVFRSATGDVGDLLAGMQPNLVLHYSAEQQTVHRDIHKLFCRATEATINSVLEKERLAAMWRDLLRAFFNVPINLFYGDEVHSSSKPKAIGANEAWAPGTRVVTTLGSGKVLRFRTSDSMYEVQLPFGVGYLRHNSIIGAEELSPLARQAIGVTSVNNVDVIHGGVVTSSKSQLPVKEPCKLFFGTQMCYLFLRLHHIIFVRLCTARQLAKVENQRDRAAHPLSDLDAPDDVDDEEGKKLGVIPPSRNHHSNRYQSFLSQLVMVLDGTIDSVRYEESCRQLLGNNAFVLYTLDKVILQALKCLQAMANDELSQKLVGLFVYHRSLSLASDVRGEDPELYLNHVVHTLSNTMEDVYRLQLLCDGGTEVIQLACQFLDLSGDKEGGVRAPQLVIPDAEDEDEPESEDVDPARSLNGGRDDGYDDPIDDGEDQMAVDDDDSNSNDNDNEMEGIRALEEMAENEGSVASSKDLNE